MQSDASGPLTRGERVVVTSATLAALALLAYVSAQWTWVFLGPRPISPTPDVTEPQIRAGAARYLFGNADASRMETAPSPLGIAVVGIVAAAPGGRGQAVFQVEGRRSVVARENEEIVPGVRVAEISNDRVVIERSGRRETLTWAKKPVAPPAAPAVR